MCLFYPSPPKKPNNSGNKRSRNSRSSTASSSSSAHPLPQIHIHGAQPPTSSLPSHLVSLGGAQPWILPQQTSSITTTTTTANNSGGASTRGGAGDTNIYLAPAMSGAVVQEQSAKKKEDVPAQPQPQLRRRSSVLIEEIEGIRKLARRVGEAARRGSATSLYREERRERERERERARDEDKSTKGTVDEEARRLATQNGEVVRKLVHERDVKVEAEKLFERERERDRERTSVGYYNFGFGAGSGGGGLIRSGNGLGQLIAPPPVVSGFGGGGVYVPVDPWRGVLGAYGYGQGHSQDQWGGMVGRVNSSAGSAGEGRGRSIEFPSAGGNHIHVHTAPLIQGPSISGVQTPVAGGERRHGGSSSGYAAAGMGGGEHFVGYGFGDGMAERKVGLGMGMGMSMGDVLRGRPGREWERERERIWRGGLGGMLY